MIYLTRGCHGYNMTIWMPLGSDGFRLQPLQEADAVYHAPEDVGLLGEGVAADLNVHFEIVAHVEGRIDVNQFQPALGLDFLPQ